MVAYFAGLVGQSGSRDEDGHRTYTLDFRVITDTILDGPEIVGGCPGLYLPGEVYSIDNDYDPWAFCTPELTIRVHPQEEEGEPTIHWIVSQTFTTKPRKRCQDTTIENPLLEPYTISGDFVHQQKEQTKDRFGNPLNYSNHELITGALVEDKYSYPTITIGYNASIIPFSTYVLLINKLNDATLWGVPRRCVRFADVKWERLLYGVCFYYYKTTYTFEVNIDGFDVDIQNCGTTHLKQGGNIENPKDFIVYKDDNDENAVCLLGLDGYVIEDIADVVYLRPEIAKEGNLLLLGIPTVLE
jgi:hypothetical protein